jgi:two-component system sensor histidine kinase CreC
MAMRLSGVDSSGPWEAGLVTLAISNLLQNALDFSAENSVIELELAPHRITVSDQGPGVAEPLLARLGERFFTTPDPTESAAAPGWACPSSPASCIFMAAACRSEIATPALP